jgi:hypothetical protein
MTTVEKIELAGTETTPSLTFNKQASQFKIEGRSLMEGADVFYKPLQEWLIEYRKNPNPKTELNIHLDYLNIETSRKFLDLFKILEGIPQSKIIWQFSDEDEDMEEMGQELAELVRVPFEFRTN